MSDAIEPRPISDPADLVHRGALIGLQIGCLIYLVGMFGVAIPDPPWYRTLRAVSAGCPDPVEIQSS
jgi:hypothetical protein